MGQLKSKKIGFIGLGSLGKPMAANLVKAKYPLTVFDISQEPLAELEKLGAKIARSAGEVGEKSDTVIIMVPGYSQMKDVVYSPDGVLSGMQKGSTLVVTSTLSPAEIMEVEKVTRQAGVHLIDSPVSGGQQKAREGSLTFMVGGDGEVVRGNEDVLQTMGANVTHVGKVGQGQATKLVNQMLVSANIVAVAETLVMAKKLGLDQKAVVDIISKSAGDSFVLRTMAPSMIERDFTARAAVSIFTKDTGIIMNTAQELNVPLLVSSAAYNVSRVAESRGFAEQDMTAVIKVFEELAGVAGDDKA